MVTDTKPDEPQVGACGPQGSAGGNEPVSESVRGNFRSVLIPLSIDQCYTYAEPAGVKATPGSFVMVPFGARQRVGVVWPTAPDTRLPSTPKSITGVISPLRLTATMQQFVMQVARYTLAPLGLVLRMVLPVAEAWRAPEPRRVCERGKATLSEKRALSAARMRVLATLDAANCQSGHTPTELAQAAGVSRTVVTRLIEKGVLKLVSQDAGMPSGCAGSNGAPLGTAAQLTGEQMCADHELAKRIGNGFATVVLDGVTGSGKTEVYLSAARRALACGGQVLILLPEISLTSTLVSHVEKRFGFQPALWHSGVGAGAKRRVWWQAAKGDPLVVIGARSALFLPYAALGLIVVDEEHDNGFKQETHANYHGRDMAVLRASLGNIPVVLSSATVSLETAANVMRGRYQRVALSSRYARARPPQVELVDLRRNRPGRSEWISGALKRAVEAGLARNEQALLFINRRGYAPLTLCRSCGYRLQCSHCSAWLVEHRKHRRLMCHFCGKSIAVPRVCPDCGARENLAVSGPGIEWVAEECERRFPDARVLQLSSDLGTAGLDRLKDAVHAIRHRMVDIIVGTQIVAKGHHFPYLTLVGVVDGDSHAGVGDPRERERIFQLFHQVIGRAGRSTLPGRALIQTYNPGDPLFKPLLRHDREGFIREEIGLRRRYALPPFCRYAAVIVSSGDVDRARGWANRFRACLPAESPATGLDVLGPADAPRFRIRGQYRCRFLVRAPRIFDVQSFLRRWRARLGTLPRNVTLRFDIDPYDFH